jgi:hypothetical protein
MRNQALREESLMVSSQCSQRDSDRPLASMGRTESTAKRLCPAFCMCLLLYSMVIVDSGFHHMQSNQSWLSSWKVQPPLHRPNRCFPHHHPRPHPTHRPHPHQTLRHLQLVLRSSRLYRVGLLLVGLLRPIHQSPSSVSKSVEERTPRISSASVK